MIVILSKRVSGCILVILSLDIGMFQTRSVIDSRLSLIAWYGFWATNISSLDSFLQFRTHKVIYRRYAGLFFSLCVDITDNELAYLECIHLFVEILDHFFSNVCELDLVFNFHKVCCFLWIFLKSSGNLCARCFYAVMYFLCFSLEFSFWFFLFTH